MTNTKANVNIKIDSDVKEQATMLLRRMGLDQTTAIDMFFRQIIAEHRLPFQPVVTPTIDEQIIAAVKRNTPKKIELSADEDGNIFVDKELHPEIYNWAVNG
ncbi:MAG: type II toxin-antitoxin system RelB/DinJ family antitoxin [Treponema sp.]|nr:type II toxin-antitoxin system RelB/DinJ family antitoxin [Treponema sp.]